MYGDLNDWENVIGTGPFLITDYVSGSIIKFERNPNYWQNDPLNPGNQLPYVDEVKIMIMTDPSTRLAALRSAQLDYIANDRVPIYKEDADSLMATNPELLWSKYFVLSARSASSFFRRSRAASAKVYLL